MLLDQPSAIRNRFRRDFFVSLNGRAVGVFGLDL